MRRALVALFLVAVCATAHAEKKKDLAIENLEHFLQIAPKNDADRGKAKDTLNELKRKR
jgi:hypothetical protein